MDEPVLADLAKIVLVFVLIGLNGFFVAAEFSLVAARRARIDELATEGNALARLVKRVFDHLDRHIAATQLGITMSSLALGWLGVPLLAGVIEPAFAWLPGLWPQISTYTIGIALAFALITTLHIVLGELVPKSVALQRAEATSLFIAGPLSVFLWLLRPVIYSINSFGDWVVRLLGMQPAHGTELVHSENELRLLVTASHENGILEESEEEMLHKVFAFADKEAHQVMVPRTEIVAVPAEMTIGDFMIYEPDHLHTRFPVYEGTLDSIVGIIHLKDAIAGAAAGQLDQPVRSVMRPVLVVPETIHIDELLRQLQRRRMHMAVLVDEYGGTAGLATMEDLLEEIVGEIRDEFDVEEPGLEDRHDGTWSVDGLMSIDEFNERFGQSLQDPNYDTIAGYVFGQLGRVAEVGDEVSVDALVLRVEELDGLRIATLRVLPEPGTTLVVEDDDFAEQAESGPPGMPRVTVVDPEVAESVREHTSMSG